MAAGGYAPDLLGSEAPRPFMCLLVLIMTGSRKTTFVHRLTGHLHTHSCPPYVINLDPAVHEVPFPANIDIHDTVKYEEVRNNMDLGPMVAS
ncbi:GPN-loop GTPase 1 [Fukomys damarensis]|uniref:GPN-loop GTPase n=1 Tax=Fukomys damarensis TaxID=885580 RepID=A0A091CS93_FUKDA|nr:GPN-loop GTPase 1 [Fukomys damarensis]